MNIAIVGSFNFHLECIPFLLEMFLNDNVNIYINTKSDAFNMINYFKTLYKFNVIYDNITSEILTKNDLVFKLTSNDPCLNDKKIISILHINLPQYMEFKCDKYLSLTPYVNGTDIIYTFPVFNPKVNKSTDKIVTLVGYYKNESFDNDLINFIKINKNYKFNFITWGSPNYTNITKLNLPNVKIHKRICKGNLIGMDTAELMNIINNSKYILSKKYINYDRFSGQLGLAVSFEKPLLLDLKTKTSYNLPGLPFEKDLCEIGNLDNIDNKQYEAIIDDIKTFKLETLETNRSICNTLV